MLLGRPAEGQEGRKAGGRRHAHSTHIVRCKKKAMPERGEAHTVEAHRQQLTTCHGERRGEKVRKQVSQREKAGMSASRRTPSPWCGVAPMSAGLEYAAVKRSEQPWSSVCMVTQMKGVACSTNQSLPFPCSAKTKSIPTIQSIHQSI